MDGGPGGALVTQVRAWWMAGGGKGDVIPVYDDGGG